jgi:D-alanyl-lipoteichoic acid acyltransferase DltB (MBOAT superfamily)
MNFAEIPFVILLLVTYGLWIAGRKQYESRLIVLLVASLIFYGYHQWLLLPLLLTYCLVGWGTALWIVRSRRPGWVLGLGITFNLGVLAYWKYTPMLLGVFAQLAAALELPAVAEPPQGWLLPFGISFFSFTGVAYMVDVYRGVIAPETNLIRFTVFKSFFPQLVAGPILRARDFLTELTPERMPDSAQSVQEALVLLARGYFKKMVLADRIGPAIDPFFLHVADASTSGVWAGPYVYLYALQIYFDFSGYTDIARGLGLMFGFRWPDNFRNPYLAPSLEEFWRRWHITLSQFLKDYLYIPLGGSRGSAWRTKLNLFLTMLLGGMWHGSSWSFLVWGSLHGVFLVVHRAWSACRLRAVLLEWCPCPHWLRRSLATVLTFHCVCLGWCFFRLTDIDESLACVRKCIVFDRSKCLVGGAADPSLWSLVISYGLLVLAASQGHRLFERVGRDLQTAWSPLVHGMAWGGGATMLLLSVLLAPRGEAAQFIYFQF